MPLLAYIDVRPILFLAGLPVFVGLSLLACRAARARISKLRVMLCSALLFVALFVVLLTGFGPFIGQKEIREFMMTWEIKPDPANAMREPEVVFTFVDFPGHHIGEHSGELAAHLRQLGEQPVNVAFEVTSDYGRVRGFDGVEIAGLRGWKSEWSYAGSSGSSGESPWE